MFKRLFFTFYYMGLIERLYPEDDESIEFRDHRWSQFGLLSPKMSYYNSQALTRLNVGDKKLLIRQVRNSFFPQGTSDEEVKRKFYERLKAFEYAHRVLSINEDPQVIASMIAYQEILKWFDIVLGGFTQE